MRERIQSKMSHLEKYYRSALKDNELQEAFDAVWSDWANEQGAMIYAQVISVYDLLNLTGVISNRREIMRLSERLKALEERAR